MGIKLTSFAACHFLPSRVPIPIQMAIGYSIPVTLYTEQFSSFLETSLVGALPFTSKRSQAIFLITDTPATVPSPPFWDKFCSSCTL